MFRPVIRGAALIAAGWLALSPLAALADTGAPSPLGVWSRGDGKARVKIDPCGGKLCAVNVWIKPGTQDEKVGDVLELDVAPAGDGKLAGQAWDPQRKMHYRFSMTVGAQDMTTRGCVLAGLICKSMPWTRQP